MVCLLTRYRRMSPMDPTSTWKLLFLAQRLCNSDFCTGYSAPCHIRLWLPVQIPYFHIQTLRQEAFTQPEVLVNDAVSVQVPAASKRDRQQRPDTMNAKSLSSKKPWKPTA